MFSACLEHVIRRCNWSNFGVNIDGVRLNHLRFADDIVLITDSPEHASEMLHRLDEEGSQCDLTINTSKTNVMRNQFSGDTPVILKGGGIEDLDEYVYLGSQLNMRNDLNGELARRRKAGWAAFYSIRSVLEDTRDCKLRADLFNSTMLPALSYAGETWALTKSLERHLMSTQASIERRLLSLTLSRQRELKLHNSNVRAMSTVKDVLVHVDEAKDRFVRHLMRGEDGRWSSATIRWYPREKKRPHGRPPLRWAESLAYRNNVYDPESFRVTTHWTTRAKIENNGKEVRTRARPIAVLMHGSSKYLSE
ncbi:unnamed protein product [Haemonchus placei]|uniref:Reverse transcriptase domain-containing protein n=1 Tax=Haemonchus placei TaxID=6290 RepID=A0A3P7WJV2_HAEPC|nr:unnamed protein product [Haemonchus placei]